MHQSLRTRGDRPLSQICIPGTHDAAMGGLTCAHQLLEDIVARFTPTQSQSIDRQLELGSRYLDIRPEMSHRAGWTGHNDSTFGALGQSMQSIINAVNAFTAKHQELIILNLSHATQTDDNFIPLNQGEWNQLLKQLSKLNNRSAGPYSPSFERLYRKWKGCRHLCH